MPYLIEKNWHFRGPNFKITANVGGTKIINDIGICSFLPWHPSDRPVVARHEEP